MTVLKTNRKILLFALGTLPLFSQPPAPTVDATGVPRAAAETPYVLPTSTTLPAHKIVPNDLLSIVVFDEPNVSKPAVRVDSDGTIAIPYLAKRLKVEDLMPREVEAVVAGALIDQQILVHPSVSVSITEYATRLISVVGNVKQPNQFPITSPISLIEAMAKAGWTTPEAGPDLLFTKSAAEAPRRISILQLQNGDQSVNMTLTGGEVISVPDAPKVWVTGNVTKPQAVSIRNPNDATVLKVVASVEGLTQYYNKTAYIYRPDATGHRQEIVVALSDIMHRKAQDVNLLVDDILLIPDDNGAKRRQLLQIFQTLGGAAASSSVIAFTR